MKVLFVVNSGRSLTTHRWPLLLGLKAAGYEIHIAVPHDKSDLRAVIAQGFHIHRYKLGQHSLNPKNEIRSIYHLVRLYRQIKPDIVQHVALKAVLYGNIAAYLTQTQPSINLIPGLGYLFTASSYKTRPLRYILFKILRFTLQRLNSHLIFQNREDQNVFLSQGEMESIPSSVIQGSGVSVEDCVYRPEFEGSDIKVILPARMLWSKGVGEFVEAAEQLHHAGVKARFILIGACDTRNPDRIDEVQLNQWHRRGFVEWWGWQTDMAKIITESNIVCLPTYREGVPKVLLEACAFGRPIVTTDTPGCQDVVVHGYNGLLVPPKDAKALAAALKQLIQNPRQRQEMGQNGRSRVMEHFTSECVVQATLDIYESLITAKR